MKLFENKVSRNTVLCVLVLLAIASGLFLRGVFLTADPPADISVSGGIIADPGQYAYGAKNKVLFDRWTFAGWEPYSFSPLMHYLNYFIYKSFGVSYVTHKLIPLIFSSLTLLLLLFIVYRRFNPRQAFFTSILFSFSYPVIIFSRFANREYPMVFFLLGAVFLFSEAAGKRKSSYYFYSAILFCLSFLCKGSGSFLISLFLTVGILWVIEKKTKLMELFYFAGTLILFFVGWYFVVYLSYKPVIDTFVRDNKNLRALHSLSRVIENILNSPFMVSLRSDPFILITASLIILFYIYWKLTQKKDIDPFVELCTVWLGIGAFMHGIVSYRPTRFFVVLLIPIAFLAGYMLDLLWNKRTVIKINFRLILSAFLTLAFLVFLGILPYFRFLNSGSAFFKFYFIVFIILLPVTLFLKRPYLRKFMVILILLSSFILNMVYFKKWAEHREYMAVNISNILNRALPPSRIAGNWSSLLGTGTRHRTYFAWKGFFNWEKDFLKKNKIEYLLLTSGRFADEIGDYKNFFKDEFKTAHLLADFRMFNSVVHLYSLKPDRNPNRLECETFARREGKIIYEDGASRGMAVNLPSSPSTGSFKLSRRFSPAEQQGNRRLLLRAKGDFKIEIRLLSGENNEVTEKTLFFKSGDSYKIKELFQFKGGNIREIRIEISRLKSDGFLDYFEVEKN
jgi:4-amino-4-deoxy-L-arabinose transferase-like glycosyltransferase